MSIKGAGALLFAGIVAICGVRLDAGQVRSIRYACDPRQNLLVQSDARLALVRFQDRTYELKRKGSDIGIKYASPTATLIIDGPSAIFVAEDRLQLGACTQMVPLAEGR